MVFPDHELHCWWSVSYVYMHVSPRDYSDAARLHCAPATSNTVLKRDIRRILLHVIVTCYMLLLRLHLLHEQYLGHLTCNDQ